MSTRCSGTARRNNGDPLPPCRRSQKRSSSPTSATGARHSLTSPAPSKNIAGHVLAVSGSAPGHNGIPYEAYHQGVEPVTEALAQAVLAAHHDPPVLDVTLGPNVDLLLWIPKKAGADRPDGQRPLQLPICFRRLFGSVISSMVAPQVEPRFSERQASVKGGNCAENITGAFEHLGGFDEPAHSPAGPLWRGVLGDAAEGAEAACARARKSSLRACPAMVLADQSKAFERMGMAWLRKVMDGWKFPRWVREAFRRPAGGEGSAYMHRRGPRVRQDASKGTGNGEHPESVLVVPRVRAHHLRGARSDWGQTAHLRR